MHTYARLALCRITEHSKELSAASPNDGRGAGTVFPPGFLKTVGTVRDNDYPTGVSVLSFFSEFGVEVTWVFIATAVVCRCFTASGSMSSPAPGVRPDYGRCWSEVCCVQ